MLDVFRGFLMFLYVCHCVSMLLSFNCFLQFPSGPLVHADAPHGL